ncbi:MAG: uroporphyrinogen decarboxylase family protein [Thermoguttaceae bacterium]
MKNWLKGLVTQRERFALPIMTSPGIPLIGATPIETFRSGTLQFQAIKALTEKFPMVASLTMMDLSVEAEAFGAPVHFSEKENPNIAAPVINDASEIAQLQIPAIGTARTSECLLAAKLCAENITDRPTLGGMIGPFSLAGRLIDMSKMMLLAAMDPDATKALLEKATLFLIEYAKAFKQAGCGGVIIAEPAAGLVSPKMCQEFSADYIKRIVKAVQDDNFIVVLHNCGKTEKQVAQLLSTGADALHVGNTVDVCTILDQVPAGYPVMGNISPAGVFLMGTQLQMYDTTTELLNATKNYTNFVISSGCDIPPGTPIQNVESFFEAVKDFNGKM